jgi:hypothetical protein
LVTEAIVAAGGGVVAGDEGDVIEEEGPEVVNAPAYALATPSSVRAAATLGQAMGDVRSTDQNSAGRGDINAAARAVAAIGPVSTVAAKGLVLARAESVRDAVPLAT